MLTYKEDTEVLQIGNHFAEIKIEELEDQVALEYKEKHQGINWYEEARATHVEQRALRVESQYYSERG